MEIIPSLSTEYIEQTMTAIITNADLDAFFQGIRSLMLPAGYLRCGHVRGISGSDSEFWRKNTHLSSKKRRLFYSRLFLRGRSRKNVILWGRDHTLRYEVCP